MNNNLRIYYSIESNPLMYFYVDNVDEAVKIIIALSIRDLNDENIEFNIMGLEMLDEDNKWCEWYNEEALDLNDYIENEYSNIFEKMRGMSENENNRKS